MQTLVELKADNSIDWVLNNFRLRSENYLVRSLVLDLDEEEQLLEIGTEVAREV